MWTAVLSTMLLSRHSTKKSSQPAKSC
ncbi:hypothetical protein GCK32_005768 [Trichostrongylus colubriformis]|uniref:Uncharacterized protein n=1 Tax=Trichostrongylus colubriformis TaxID=6319 RepID=A0AAN8IX39_TRICO